MVIFGPIDQFGCCSACSGVAALIASSDQVRNGPPDAVRMMRRTSSRRTGAERLEDGVVLGIDGKHGGAGDGGAPHEQGAGTHQAFLVGKRDGGAAVDGGQRRLQADRTADRRHQPISRTLRGLEQTGLAGRRLDTAAGQGFLQLAIGCRISDHGEPCADLTRDFRQRRRIAPRADRLDAIAFRRALDQIDRADADRAGSAEDGDAAHGRGRRWFRSREVRYRHALTTPAGRARHRRRRRARGRSGNR